MSSLLKNVTGQKWRVFAFNYTTGAPVTGDAANITAEINKDWAGAAATNDVNPTEDTNGYYWFDLTQAESNAGRVELNPESSTANIIVMGDPPSQTTVPQYFPDLGIESDGDLAKVNALDGHTPISPAATAALEDQYDGTGLAGDTYPATQAAVANIATGSAAISTTPKDAPNGFVITTGTAEANDEDSAHALDGTTHDLEDDAGTTDCHYIFDVGGNGVPVNVTWHGYVNSNGDSYAVYAYNWAGAAWQQVATLNASNGSTVTVETYELTTAHVGTGANIGLVHLRFYSTDGTKLATDRILCSYAVVAQSVGYADGAIWVDSAGVAGSEVYVNGTADNPCPWANALVINAALGLNRLHIANDNTVTLLASCDDKTLFGDHWYLALGGQSINDSKFIGASVTGIASAVDHAKFRDCEVGAVTMPPCEMHDCGVGQDDGLFAAASPGEYVLHNCFSMVAGAGTPDFNFSGLGSATGINVRGWHGGAAFTLDANCTLSHEVGGGGGTTITTGGGSVEVRGVTRAVTLNMSAAEVVQFVGVTGPVTVNGTTTGTVNLYGVAGPVVDNSSAATITNNSVSRETVNLEVDAALSDYDGPTNAEMLARTLPVADYFDPAADTVANVTAVATLTGHTPQTADHTASIALMLADTNEIQSDLANGGRLDLILDAINTAAGATQTDLADGGRLDIIIDAISAAAVTTQADLVNGGRLDLIFDAIKAVTDALTAAAATKLALSSGTIIAGTAELGTLSQTQMTTDLSEATDGHYDDKLIIWTSGALVGQVSSVSAYVGSLSTGLITYPSVTEAPSAGDTFILT